MNRDEEVMTLALATVPCPECGCIGTLSWRRVLVAKPIGTYSLAGQGMKVSAYEVVEVRCAGDCPLVMHGVPGEDHMTRVDGRRATD